MGVTTKKGISSSPTELSDDQTPVLGGDLDIGANTIVGGPGGSEGITIDVNGDMAIGSTIVSGSQLNLPQEDDAATPTLSFGDGNTGFYESSDNNLRISHGGTVTISTNGS